MNDEKAITMTNIRQAIPDWETSSLFLVWPGGLEGRGKLENSYRDFLVRIPDDINLHLIVKKIETEGRIQDVILKKRPGGSVFSHVLPKVMDIWIRDWAPVPVRDSNGETILVKAKYKPAYISEKDTRFAEGDDEAGRGLANILELRGEFLPLIWDIGNFTHNGDGIAVVTKRLLDDNLGFNESSIREMFNEKFGIEKLIFIDVEPEDPTGHVDGTVRFLDETTIAVARYPEDHIEENTYCDNLARRLKNDLGDGFSILRIQNGPIEDLVIEGIPSARGNHLNFLRTGKYIFMPCYNEPEDNMAIDIIKNHMPGIKIIPVNAKEISRRGGVLDCISWGM